MGKKNINDLLNRLFISEVVGEVGQLGRVLDLGCGEQPYREVYGAHAERVVAVDISRRGSESTDAFVRGSAVAIPFADSSFDFVLCSEVLEHVPDPRRAIGEIARVLRPGGRLVLTVPFLYPIHEEPWDFWRFTKWGLEVLFAEHFTVQRMHARGGVSAVYLTQLAGLSERFAWATRRMRPRRPSERAGPALSAAIYAWCWHRARLSRPNGPAAGLRRVLERSTLGYLCLLERSS